jgi:urease accessory protein UreF
MSAGHDDETQEKAGSANRKGATEARSRQRAIGKELRRMFDEVVQEPVPNEFLDLLKRIDERSGN